MIPFKLLLLINVIWIQLSHSCPEVVQLKQWEKYDNKTRAILADRYPNARPYLQSGSTVWWYDATFYCKRHKNICATFSYETENMIMANNRQEYVGLTCTDNGKLSHEVMVEIRELNFYKSHHPVVVVHHNCAGKNTIKKFTLKLPEIPISERMGYQHYEHIIRSPYMGEISNDAAGQQYRNETLFSEEERNSTQYWLNGADHLYYPVYPWNETLTLEERDLTEKWLNKEDYSMYSVYPYRYVERLNGKCSSDGISQRYSIQRCRISIARPGNLTSQYN